MIYRRNLWQRIWSRNNDEWLKKDVSKQSDKLRTWSIQKNFLKKGKKFQLNSEIRFSRHGQREDFWKNTLSNILIGSQKGWSETWSFGLTEKNKSILVQSVSIQNTLTIFSKRAFGSFKCWHYLMICEYLQQWINIIITSMTKKRFLVHLNFGLGLPKLAEFNYEFACNKLQNRVSGL